MLTIKNGDYEVKINEFGATLDSIKYKGEEYLWQGDEKSWTGKDVAIFPFVARLKDGFYLNDGKKYSLNTHGIVRSSNLKVEEIKENKVVLSLSYSEETLKVYPFKFKFFAIFSLEDKLNVEYLVENVDDKKIYFGLGGHPALKVPVIKKEDIEEIQGNYIKLDKKIDLTTYTLNEDGCFVVGEKYFGSLDTIELSKKLMQEYKTLMFKADEFEHLMLVRKDGKKIDFKFENAPILALWSNERLGGYICIEPWTSLPDALSPQREIKHKKSILSIDPKETYSLKYSIKIV